MSTAWIAWTAWINSTPPDCHDHKGRVHGHFPEALGQDFYAFWTRDLMDLSFFDITLLLGLRTTLLLVQIIVTIVGMEDGHETIQTGQFCPGFSLVLS